VEPRFVIRAALVLVAVVPLLMVPVSFLWSPPGPIALVVATTGLAAILLFQILGGLKPSD
jgi:hypothetical protein